MWRLLAPAAVSFVVVLGLTPLVADEFRRRGIVGRDVHKVGHPAIPEMCGVSMIVAFFFSLAVSAFLFPQWAVEFLGVALATIPAILAGVLDDLYRLNPLLKASLPALGAIPLLALSLYSPRPLIPFVGRARLTYVYPFILPFAIAITSNATNMIDVLNGSMSGSMAITCSFLAFCSLVMGEVDGVLLFLSLAACFWAFFYYNSYPALVFVGNVASLGMGAAFGASVIVSRLDVVAVVAYMPYIMNGFWILTSVGGFKERREIVHRPTKTDGLRIRDSRDPLAPITLVRLLVAGRALGEEEVVYRIMALSALAGILSLITVLLELL